MSIQSFQELVEVMARLRGDDGCPWDREQTHTTLRPFLLEETYEVLEALDRNDDTELKEELGDLLLQIVFHARVAEERNAFDIDDVIQGIHRKLIRRHPHVFGSVRIDSAEEQRVHWEGLKQQEGKTSVVDGVPEILPSLLRAHRVQQKASTVGFDWETAEQVWKKVEEELSELESAVQQGEQEQIEEEFGDLLFALVNLSRFLNLNPEDALRNAVRKFIRRFQKVESAMRAEGKALQDATLEEMDAVWNRIKQE